MVGTISKSTTTTTTKKSSTSTPKNTQEELKSLRQKKEENIKVCLRLRPPNKLEASRRGRNCVELNEDRTRVTVDSPLEGEYDFLFDKIFEEETAQETVHNQIGSPLVHQLLSGRNCALIAYGQTGSGKTHTMMREGDVVGGLSSSSSSEQQRNNTNAPLLPEEDVKDEGGGGGGGSKWNRLRELLQTPDDNNNNNNNNSPQNKSNEVMKEAVIDEFTGIVPRIVRDLYKAMDKSPSTTEFTVRCSYVEIYLEQIIDLIMSSGNKITIVEKSAKKCGGNPSSLDEEEEDEEEESGENGVVVEGASEACCFDENDVIALLARGNASRTVAATKMNTDASRSHAIFMITLEQRDVSTGISKKSKMTLVDMAGSELAVSKRNKQKRPVSGGKSGQNQEAKMVNRSFSALNYVVKALTEKKSNPNASPLEIPYRRSKLTRLLKDAFGGNCSTTLLLTASPSSYNVSETISTLRFGRRCREIKNAPMINMELAPCDYRRKLVKSEKKQKELMSFVKALALECRTLKEEGTKGRLPKGSHSGPLWGSIDTILEEQEEEMKEVEEEDEEEEEVINEVASLFGNIVARKSLAARRSTTLQRKSMVLATNATKPGVSLIDQLESIQNESKNVNFDDLDKNELIHELTSAQEHFAKVKRQAKLLTESRDRAENLLGEMQSELAVLRTQNENLSVEKKKMTEDLMTAKNEIQVLSQRKLEVEHNLRTSQFRENEATVFLRQFRRFYRRLLRNKAAQGTGETGEITAKVPGVPDLNGLIDVDTLLLESGLIEEEELHDDTSVGTYRPSANALLKSTAAAKKAAKEAAALEKAGEGWDDGSASMRSSVAPMQTLSIGEKKDGLDVISEMGDGGVSEMGDNSVIKAGGGVAAMSETIEEEESEVSFGSVPREDVAPKRRSTFYVQSLRASGSDMRAPADDITSIGMRKWDMDESPLGDADESENKETAMIEDAASAVASEFEKTETDADGGAETVMTGVVDPSVISESDSESLASSVVLQSITSRGSTTGASTVTPSNLALRQKSLKTPSGRLSAMREKDLERDLLQMTERCIELQIALNEEKANVDVLTNKSGTLSKKRLAQEAIQLRQALDRKTHDLQAIIWKMNELHLINKTYNEKMANREQHVTYLEENLVNLQNTNRRIIAAQQENEKKLREELEHLKVMADAMTNPLWQFGDKKMTEKNLASRIVLPVRGKQYPDDDALLATEYDEESMNSEYSDDASSANENIDPSKAAMGAVSAAAVGTAIAASRSPHVPKTDAFTQTEPLAELEGNYSSSSKPEMVDKWTITKKKMTTDRGTEAKPVMVDQETMVGDDLEEKVSVEEIGTMTDVMDDKGTALEERGTMTDEFQDLSDAVNKEVTTFDQGTMTDEVEFAAEKVPCAETGTMTDEVEFAVEKAPCVEEGTMTEAASTIEKGTMTNGSSSLERGTMTDAASTIERGTMTAERETAEKGTITDEEKKEPDTAAAVLTGAVAGAAIATAIPDGADRGGAPYQQSRGIGAPNGDVDGNEDVVRRDAEGSARPNSTDRGFRLAAGKEMEQKKQMDDHDDEKKYGGAAVAAAGVTAAAASRNKSDDNVSRQTKDLAASQPQAKREVIMDDISSIGASTLNPPTREVAFQKEATLPEGNENSHSSARDSHKSDGHDSADEGQLPDTMFPGGKPASYQPRRFVRKMGPKIKPGVLKESKRKSGAAGSSVASSARRSVTSSRSRNNLSRSRRVG